jgi:hypothetical protein
MKITVSLFIVLSLALTAMSANIAYYAGQLGYGQVGCCRSAFPGKGPLKYYVGVFWDLYPLLISTGFLKYPLELKKNSVWI